MAEETEWQIAHSGKKLRLVGKRKRGKSFVDFFHKCCDCGLRHDVMIEHDGKTPQIDITFTRIKAGAEEQKEQTVCSTKSPLFMHCPKCGKYAAHKVTKTDPSSYHWSEDTVELFERICGSDIQYRVREKLCSECNTPFKSAEIPHEHFIRLVSTLLNEIKKRESLEEKVSNLLAHLSDCIDSRDQQQQAILKLLTAQIPEIICNATESPERIKLDQKVSRYLRPASDEEIRNHSFGEVKTARTSPDLSNGERGTITCERIFGPLKNNHCACGKYRGAKNHGIICDRCGVEVTSSTIRSVRMGHIELPVGIPSPLSGLPKISVIAVLPPGFMARLELSNIADLYDQILCGIGTADLRAVMSAHRQLAKIVLPMLTESSPKGEQFQKLALAIGLCRNKR